MFNKLKQQITNLNSKKKNDNKPENNEDLESKVNKLNEKFEKKYCHKKDFEIDFENIWKYNIEELCEYLRKYDKYSQRLRKKIEDINEEHSSFKKKFEQSEKERKKIVDDKDQFKIHLDTIQQSLDIETKEREKYRLEVESCKKEKEKLKFDLENLKKDNFNPEYSVAVSLCRGNISKIFKFIEPKYLKTMENKMEEITVFMNENLKIINTGLLDKIKYILNQNEKEEGKENQESNRSNLDDESNNGTNREDYESGRDNVHSSRSYRTEGGMNLNDLIIEMYEELHTISESLPNLENIRGKVHELVENFININETLNKYQIELKQVVTEEIENTKRELIRMKGDSDEKKGITDKKELELQSKIEEINNLKNENSKMKNTLNETQKKFENEIKILLEKITAENTTLKESNQKFKEEYEEMSKTKRKLEEDYTNENKKLLKELEEYKMNNDNLEKKMKNVDDIVQTKQKDLETKIQQEKSKYDQKVKDYSKLEESYREYKNNSAKQMDDFNRIIEKAKQIEVQFNEEKKNHKELKMKHNELVNQLEEEKKNNAILTNERGLIIKKYEEKAKQAEEDLNLKLQEKVNISKDLHIKDLEIKMGEMSEKIEQLNTQIAKFQEENETLRAELKSNTDVIISMKDKREAALKEIKRLTSQIDQLKSNQNNKKGDYVVENSYSHIPDSNNNNNNQKNSSAEKTRTNISSVDSQMIKNLTNKSFNKIIIEGNYLCILKKELEGLYRDFIPLMPWDADKKQQTSFIKLERKMNDCIQKAQDLIDTIEDMG